MANMMGGNLEQLSSLERQFQTQAATVQQLKATITRTLTGTAWTGPAADRFRDQWNGEFSSALAKLQEALNENASTVANRREAIRAATF